MYNYSSNSCNNSLLAPKKTIFNALTPSSRENNTRTKKIVNSPGEKDKKTRERINNPKKKGNKTRKKMNNSKKKDKGTKKKYSKPKKKDKKPFSTTQNRLASTKISTTLAWNR